MLTILSACMLALSAVGLWVCLFSLRSDVLGLGLTRARIVILVPLFLVVGLAAALHLIRQDLGTDHSLAVVPARP